MFRADPANRSIGAALAAALLVSAAAAAAHEHDPKHQHGGAGQATDFGRPGRIADASRTVVVRMTDAMRFSPETMHFSRGETVRLRISNVGVLPHEFVLGTKKEIAEHAEMMRRNPGMVHTDASSVRVRPGKTMDLVWQFSAPGTFFYACLVPGHREAGMQGVVTVSASEVRKRP